MTLTHQQTCEAVARWFLTLAWCDLAVCEIAGRAVPFPELGTLINGHWPSKMSLPERRARSARQRAWWKTPAAGGGILDVLALTTARKQVQRPRVAIAEIKVSVSDLRADLRAGKMLRYEPQGTHLYLAGPRTVLDRAADLGLPHYWGLIVADAHPWALRNPKKNPHGPGEPTADSRARWTTSAAISLCHKALR